VARASGRDRSAAVVAAIPLWTKLCSQLLLLSPVFASQHSGEAIAPMGKPCAAGTAWLERSSLVIQVIQPQLGGLADIRGASYGALRQTFLRYLSIIVWNKLLLSSCSLVLVRLPARKTPVSSVNSLLRIHCPPVQTHYLTNLGRIPRCASHHREHCPPQSGRSELVSYQNILLQIQPNSSFKDIYHSTIHVQQNRPGLGPVG